MTLNPETLTLLILSSLADGLNNGANEETPISIEDYEDSSDRDEIIVVDQSMETEENGSNSIGGCSSSSSSSGDEIQIISDNEL